MLQKLDKNLDKMFLFLLAVVLCALPATASLPQREEVGPALTVEWQMRVRIKPLDHHDDKSSVNIPCFRDMKEVLVYPASSSVHWPQTRSARGGQVDGWEFLPQDVRFIIYNFLGGLPDLLRLAKASRQFYRVMAQDLKRYYPMEKLCQEAQQMIDMVVCCKNLGFPCYLYSRLLLFNNLRHFIIQYGNLTQPLMLFRQSFNGPTFFPGSPLSILGDVFNKRLAGNQVANTDRMSVQHFGKGYDDLMNVILKGDWQKINIGEPSAQPPLRPQTNSLDSSKTMGVVGLIPEEIALIPCLRVIKLPSRSLLSTPRTLPCLTLLKHLDLSNNFLSRIDLRSLPHLRHIEICNNHLVEIKLPSVVSYLALEGNFLTQLNLSHCQELKLVNLSFNLLTELQIPTAQLLILSYNRLRKLDLSNLPDLVELEIHGNGLESLRLAHNPKLLCVLANGNMLTDQSLVLENLPELRRMVLCGNKFEAPNFMSQAPQLMGVMIPEKLDFFLALNHSSLTQLPLYDYMLQRKELWPKLNMYHQLEQLDIFLSQDPENICLVSKPSARNSHSLQTYAPRFTAILMPQGFPKALNDYLLQRQAWGLKQVRVRFIWDGFYLNNPLARVSPFNGVPTYNSLVGMERLTVLP